MALGFLCAGVVAAAGLGAAGAVHDLGADRTSHGGLAVVLPLLGLPFIAAAVLVGYLAYCGMRLAGRVSGRAAMSIGSLVGGIGAILLPVPYLPPWAAALIGAAAGWIWWQVIQDAIPAPVP